MENLKYIIESLLFVAEDPLTIDKLRNILETAEAKEIRAALQELSEEYEYRGGGFWLGEVAGGWQMRSRPKYHEWIKRMLQPSPQRLSKAALETLAIIAYKQPIIRADIEFIRGVDCGGVLRQLMERKLIRVLGRKEIAGRPLIYATTKLFLEMFDLKSLNDLPTPAELAEFGAQLDVPSTENAPEENHAMEMEEMAEEGQSVIAEVHEHIEGKEEPPDGCDAADVEAAGNEHDDAPPDAEADPTIPREDENEGVPVKGRSTGEENQAPSEAIEQTDQNDKTEDTKKDLT
jgi:segregation and condensation protein B